MATTITGDSVALIDLENMAPLPPLIGKVDEIEASPAAT
ncbi:hypothetical protein A8926_0142 [Saccharopolyspora spinosa]|uniref:Uncharacterized protein n=1 Tax=Saccharopolyspora spinosa TaxID=60894 RepID=A0A2N3XPR8_SACSN|nr:hypothetical protein A8926_0142 [Saccharopolyspora spinosa]